jgi:hypothetical protein
LHEEVKHNFRELNLTIITSVGLGISLGITGEIIGILIGGKMDYIYFILLMAFILISGILIFFIYWWSLPRVKIRDYFESVAIYDCSKQIFFEFFYAYYEFGASIHHLSRLINENRLEKIILKNDDKLIQFLAQYVILRLLFGKLCLHYHGDVVTLDVDKLFDGNSLIHQLSLQPDYKINVPKEFRIKKTKDSLFVLEGNNIKLTFSTRLVLYQRIDSILQRPVPKIKDIPIQIIYEKDVLSKIRSNDLWFYSFRTDFNVEFINSKLHSLRSAIRRDNKFSEKLNLINDLIYYLESQLSYQALVERIYQKIEEDRLEIFFDIERKRDKIVQRMIDDSMDQNHHKNNDKKE